MKKKGVNRTTAVVLLCWMLTAGVIFCLAWNNRQVTLVGESEHWRGTLSIPRPGDPLRDTVEGACFVLTWVGSREEYRQYGRVEYHLELYGGGGYSHSVNGERGDLSRQLVNEHMSVGWVFWNNPQASVSVSLDAGPTEEFALTVK